MSQRPAAVLLDMDGTLFDSESVYKSLWQKTAAQFSINLDDQSYRPFIGARFDRCQQLMQALGGPQLNMAEFLQAMNNNAGDITSIPLKPGVMALFEWLESSALRAALVTSGGMHMVRGHFASYGGTDRFEVIVSGDDVANPKPDPEPYRLACSRLNLAPGRCIAVEDSNTGARSAIAAGCPTVFIPDVLPADNDVAEAAAITLPSLVQLPQWLAQQL